MESDWNKLIERYLNNELSEEGNDAFEQELQLNSNLKEEFELHLDIQKASKRAYQREQIVNVGKSYHFAKNFSLFLLSSIVILSTFIGSYLYLNQSENLEGKRTTEIKDVNVTKENFIKSGMVNTNKFKVEKVSKLNNLTTFSENSNLSIPFDKSNENRQLFTGLVKEDLRKTELNLNVFKQKLIPQFESIIDQDSIINDKNSRAVQDEVYSIRNDEFPTVSSHSILNYSTNKTVVTVQLLVPIESYILVSEKKKGEYLISIEYDEGQGIKSYGKVNIPVDKIKKVKSPDGKYYYVLTSGNHMITQELTLTKSYSRKLKDEPQIRGTIKCQLLSLSDTIIPTTIRFQTIVGASLRRNWVNRLVKGFRN